MIHSLVWRCSGPRQWRMDDQGAKWAVLSGEAQMVALSLLGCSGVALCTSRGRLSRLYMDAGGAHGEDVRMGLKPPADRVDAAVTLAENHLVAHCFQWPCFSHGATAKHTHTNPLSSALPAQVPTAVAAAPQPQEVMQTLGQGVLEVWSPLMGLNRYSTLPTPSPSVAGTYSIPVRCQERAHRALVDSGCLQALVHPTLV